MALDPPQYDLPVIVLLVLCPVLFTIVAIYHFIIYLLREGRRRKEERASANAFENRSSMNTAEAPRRDLHRWVPALPSPTPTTPGFSRVPGPGPGPRSARSRESESDHSSQTGSLIASQSAPSTRSLHPETESRPISEVDVLQPPSNANVLMPPTPLPSAFVGPRSVVYPVPQHQHHHWQQVQLRNPFSDPDPFSDPGPPYAHVRRADPNTGAHAAPHERGHGHGHGHGSPVAAAAPASSVRNSADAVSITTSSTLPPSYRTHRPTHPWTASDAPFPIADHARRRDMPGEHLGRPEQRSRYYPRKSVDGGVRLEGGPVDPVTGTGRGLGQPPRYRRKV